MAIYGSAGSALAGQWQPQLIVVLGHMRAGSSLTTSLLAEHPEIAGLGELHLPYRKHTDLHALTGKIAVAQRQLRPTAGFAADKILHNYLLEPADVELLNHPNVSVTFIVREPVETLASLQNALGYSSDEAASYYVERLAGLRQLATGLTGTQPPCALRYHDLVHHTTDVFRLWKDWLGLSNGFTENYEPRLRGSDPSANHRSGRILKNVERQSTIIDPGCLDRAQEAYDLTWPLLAGTCLTVGQSDSRNRDPHDAIAANRALSTFDAA